MIATPKNHSGMSAASAMQSTFSVSATELQSLFFIG